MPDIVETAMPQRTWARRLLLAVWSLAIVVAGALLGQLFLAPFSKLLVPAVSDATSAALRQLAYLVSGFGPVYLLLAISVWIRERRGFGYLFGFVGNAAGGVGLALLVGALLGAVPFIFATLLGKMELSVAPATPPALAMFLGAAGLCVQSTSEELVFRGWLMPALAKTGAVVPAVLISSLAFALAHSLNPGITLINILGLFLAGAALGMLTLRTRMIWPAAIAHTLWNWIQYQGMNWTGSVTKAGTLIIAHDPTGGVPFGGSEPEQTAEFLICSGLAFFITFLFRAPLKGSMVKRQEV